MVVLIIFVLLIVLSLLWLSVPFILHVFLLIVQPSLLLPFPSALPLPPSLSSRASPSCPHRLHKSVPVGLPSVILPVLVLCVSRCSYCPFCPSFFPGRFLLFRFLSSAFKGEPKFISYRLFTCYSACLYFFLVCFVFLLPLPLFPVLVRSYAPPLCPLCLKWAKNHSNGLYIWYCFL